MPPIDPPATQSSVVDAEMVDQQRLRAHHVADGHDRKIEAVRLAGRRIERGGPVEPMQPPRTFEQIMKNRSVSIGLPGPTIVSHQPGLAGDGVRIGDMLVAGQRVADEDRVGFARVERRRRSGRRRSAASTLPLNPFAEASWTPGAESDYPAKRIG